MTFFNPKASAIVPDASRESNLVGQKSLRPEAEIVDRIRPLEWVLTVPSNIEKANNFILKSIFGFVSKEGTIVFSGREACKAKWVQFKIGISIPTQHRNWKTVDFEKFVRPIHMKV